jgi:hypothetical protein
MHSNSEGLAFLAPYSTLLTPKLRGVCIRPNAHYRCPPKGLCAITAVLVTRLDFLSAVRAVGHTLASLSLIHDCVVAGFNQCGSWREATAAERENRKQARPKQPLTTTRRHRPATGPPDNRRRPAATADRQQQRKSNPLSTIYTNEPSTPMNH